MSESTTKPKIESVEVPDGVDTHIVSEMASNLHLRRYEKVECLVERCLLEHSWSETVSLIRRIPVRTVEIKHGWVWWKQSKKTGILPVSEGKIRDGLLSLLGLDHVTGIDVDLLKAFGRFRGGTLQEIREKTQSKAMKILNRQIAARNTFFLDTGRMKGTTFESLVPEIIRRRTEEFTALGDRPSFSRAARTYYGFTYLTESLSREDTDALHDVCHTPIEFSGKRPSYQRTIFSHCSEQLTDLLLNHLRLTFARPQTQGKGADSLGLIADSRSLGVLHATLKKKTEDLLWGADPLNPVKRRVMWALGEIGHPSSLEHLKPLIGNTDFDGWALWAISGISHPDALEVLLERAFREPLSRYLCSRSTAIEYLWKPQLERAVVPLVELLQDKSVSHWALNSLVRMGKAAIQDIMENLDLVRDVIIDSYRSEGLMDDLLEYIPEILSECDFRELLLEMISRYPSLLTKVFECQPKMFHNREFKSSILSLLNCKNPTALIGALHREGFLEIPEFRETALTKVKDVARSIPKMSSWRLEPILSVPMLYESERVQDALAKVIRIGKEPCRVLRTIRDHHLLGSLPIIHEAVIDLLRVGEWDVWCLEDIVESKSVMRNERVRAVVAETLASLWSNPRNVNMSVQTDYDSSTSLWVYHLFPLREYPDMGKIPEFQEAVANLLRYEDYPDYLLQYGGLKGFDGLMESEPVKRETDRIAAEKAAEEERRKRRWSSMRRLSEHEIEEEIRKAREAYWDHYDERGW